MMDPKIYGLEEVVMVTTIFVILLAMIAMVIYGQ